MNQAELKIIIEKHGKWLKNEPGGERAKLTGADLTWADLAGADLTWADLAGADLAWADLAWADLTAANLIRADLTGANLIRANLTGANLIRANLIRANLIRANLTGADLTGANIDFSSWQLWCGTQAVKVDDRIFAQLLNHLLALDHPESREMRKLAVAKKYGPKHPDSEKMWKEAERLTDNDRGGE